MATQAYVGRTASDLVGGGLRLGLGAGRVALRPAVEAAALGQRAAARMTLDALDTLLTSAFADVAADRVLASPWTERTVTHALTGPLLDASAQRLVEHALASPELERLVVLAVDSPALERAVVRTLESDGMERIVAHLFESHLLDEVVERLLESEELWALVDEIARSPSVTAAVTQQSLGFADQVAGEVRDRSRSADALVERATRRLLRRRPRPVPVAKPDLGGS